MKTKHSSLGILSAICFFAFATIVPLYLENKYFNISQAKLHIFLWLGVPMAIVCIIALLFGLKKGYGAFQLTLLDIGVLLVALSFIVSTLFSSNKLEAFLGNKGWGVGALTVLLLTFFYFFLSRNLSYSPNLWLPVVLVNCFIFIFAIFHAAGIDIFGLHEGIADWQTFSYLSTLGNLNWVSGYVCLILPLILCFYLNSKDGVSTVINLVFLALAFSLTCVCRSDGMIIGLGFGSIVLIPYALSTFDRLAKFLGAIIEFCIVAMVIKFVPAFSHVVEGSQGLAHYVFELKLLIPLIVISAILLANLCYYKDRYSSRLSRVLSIVYVSAVLLVILAFVVYSMRTFSDTWGTSRGKIWRVSWEIFLSLPLGQKIVGIGPETLINVYSVGLPNCVSAHSEIVQMLLSNGILGVFSWIAMYMLFAIDFVKNKAWRSDVAIFAIPVVAYFGQSLVNGATVTNVVLLCLLTSCYQNIILHKES